MNTTETQASIVVWSTHKSRLLNLLDGLIGQQNVESFAQDSYIKNIDPEILVAVSTTLQKAGLKFAIGKGSVESENFHLKQAIHDLHWDSKAGWWVFTPLKF